MPVPVRIRLLRRAALLAAPVALALALPAGAGAAFPGANGDLAFHVWPRCIGGSVCEDAQGPTIFRMRSDGTRARRMFARRVAVGTARVLVDNDGTDPSWSPDGRRVAFMRAAASDASAQGVIVGDPVSGALRTVVSPADPRLGAGGGLSGPPAWSPDGRRIVFEWLSGAGRGAQDLYSVRDDGGDLRLIARLGAFPRGGAEPVEPAWSTHNWIVFTRVSTSIGSRGLFVRHANLWLIRPDGRDPHAITRAGGESAAWSPSGQTVAYQCGTWLCTLHPGGSRRMVIRFGRQPAWSPDGRRLALVGRNGVYTARTDGSGLRTIRRANPTRCRPTSGSDTSGCLPLSLDWQPLTTRAPTG